MRMTEAKLCGLRTDADVAHALSIGADYLGLVFYPPSPRAVTSDQAGMLASRASDTSRFVGVFVKPEHSFLEDVLKAVPLCMLQVHGVNSPDAIATMRQRTGCRILATISVSEPEDLGHMDEVVDASDAIIFDAKPPKTPDALPGGNGLRFDWRLLENISPGKPWFLSGGLDAENVAEAITLLRPDAVDVSSGIETAPGQKDTKRMSAFIDSVRKTSTLRKSS